MPVRRGFREDAAIVLIALVAVGLIPLLRSVRTEKLFVDRVVDGDTIALSDGTKIRYLLIDTPEKGEFFYARAKDFNRNMVEGRPVRLELDGEGRDRYGRTLAYVFVPDNDGREIHINAELLREGLAWLYVVGKNEARRDELLEAQREALDRKRGLWEYPPRNRGPYIALMGRSGRHRFHRPDCPSIKAGRKKPTIATRKEAFREGRSPCRTCKP